MISVFGCVKWFWSKFLNVLRRKPQTSSSGYQMQQFSSSDTTDRDVDSSLQAELRKNSFHDDSFAHQSIMENKANFQDLESTSYQFDYDVMREFIELIPKVELSLECLNPISDKAFQIFLSVVNDNDGFEILENNVDNFSFWIKYQETPEKFQISTMKYTYTLNATLEEYLAFQADLQIQQQIDQSIDCFEDVWEQDRTKIMYLRYKKIMFLEAREFLYVKSTRQSQDQVIEISKSVNLDNFESKNPTSKATTRAVLLISGNLIKQIDENTIEVTSYAETNMKLKLKPVMTKTATKNEIKKMVKRFRDHFK